MKETASQTRIRRVLVSPGRIHYLRFIMEAYEGIAIVTTLVPSLGLIELRMAPGCESDVDLILESESKELGLRDIMSDSDSVNSNPFALPYIHH